MSSHLGIQLGHQSEIRTDSSQGTLQHCDLLLDILLIRGLCVTAAEDAAASLDVRRISQLFVAHSAFRSTFLPCEPLIEERTL